MAIEAGSVSVVSVGATKTEGGTRAHKIEIGKKPQVAFDDGLREVVTWLQKEMEKKQ